MVGKRLLKANPADFDRLDIEDSVGTVALAFWTQNMLVKQGIILANIIKTT